MNEYDKYTSYDIYIHKILWTNPRKNMINPFKDCCDHREIQEIQLNQFREIHMHIIIKNLIYS